MPRQPKLKPEFPARVYLRIITPLYKTTLKGGATACASTDEANKLIYLTLLTKALTFTPPCPARQKKIDAFCSQILDLRTRGGVHERKRQLAADGLRLEQQRERAASLQGFEAKPC